MLTLLLKYQPCLLLLTIFLLGSPSFLVADVSSSDTSLKSNESEAAKFEAYLADKGIKIAYRLDSAPMQFQNERDQADGILIDLWRLWSIKSGIPIHFTGAYNKEAQEMVKDGRADVNAGLFESKKRAQYFDFSQEMLDSRYSLFYQPDIKSITGIKDFKPFTIGVTRGSYHEHYMREHHPELQLSLFDGYQALFKAARNREVDGFVTQSHYLHYHLSQENYNPGYKYIKTPLYVRAYKASVKKDNHSLLAVINKYLPSISREDRRVIFQNWIGKLTVSHDSKSTITLTDAERLWLKEHPVIDIGVDGNWPPIDFMDDDGYHTGIAHDFINNISAQLGVEFNIVPGPTFKRMLSKVRKGELKVASSVVKTEDRSKDL